MKICVYTGSRAEYNLLQPLVKKLELDNFFKVSLYASGMHLSKLHGWTIDEVTKNHKNIFLMRLLLLVTLQTQFLNQHRLQ